MSLAVDRRRGHLVVAVAGEVDWAGGLQLRDRLNRLVSEGHRRIVVDFTAATFVDLTGLAPLVEVLKRLQTKNGEMRIVGAGSRARNLFRVRGLHDVLVLHESVEQADFDQDADT